MLPLLIAAAFAIGDAGASPQPSPVPSASGAPLKVVREVVYDVTIRVRFDDITESYAGNPDSAPPADESSDETTGTVAVDVLAQDDTHALLIRLRSHWITGARAQVADAIVESDGTVALPAGDTPDILYELLPYFGVRFIPQGVPQSTASWSTNTGGAKTTYTLKSSSGDAFTLEKSETIPGLHQQRLHGTVLYLTDLLVPDTGDIQSEMTQMRSDGQTHAVLTLQFRRLSDSFAPGATPPPAISP